MVEGLRFSGLGAIFGFRAFGAGIEICLYDLGIRAKGFQLV